MLASLHISNYALIESLDVDFTSGLSIITGETGAGKSIILGAIDLLRGRRADTSALRDKSVKAVVEADFDLHGNEAAERWLSLQDYDLRTDGQLTLRREISPSGRSRAFINDSPANLQAMQELTLLLLDIHSQHQTQQLANPRTRLALIDSLSTDKSVLRDYKEAFEAYNDTRKRLLQLQQEAQTPRPGTRSLPNNTNTFASLRPSTANRRSSRSYTTSRAAQTSSKPTWPRHAATSTATRCRPAPRSNAPSLCCATCTSRRWSSPKATPPR